MSFEESPKPNLTSEAPADDKNRSLSSDIEVVSTKTDDFQPDLKIYTEKAGVATKQKHEDQIVLKKTLIEKIKRGEIIDEELMLVTEETLQNSLSLGLKEAVKYGRNIDNYLKLVTEETLQKALKQGLRERIITGQNISRYLLLATKETVEKIKRDQKLIRIGLTESIKDGKDIDEEYINLITEENLQEALELGLKERIIKELNIDKYLVLAKGKTLQQAIESCLIKAIKDGSNINKYLGLATEETVGKIKQDQKLIGGGLIEFLKNDRDIDEEYLRISSEKTLQESLGLGLKEMIINGKSFDKYLKLVTAETLQKTLRQGILERSIKGQDIEECLKLITAETRKSLSEDVEQLKESVVESAGLFFKEDFKLKIEKHLKEVVGLLSKEQIWNALFDHTTLPVGIKFHVPNNTPLSQMISATGGFVAHGEEQCFVANPLHNQTLITIVFNAMEKYLQENNFGLEDIKYIQTCCLGRLPNKESGIATLAFLMVKDKKEQIDSSTLVHGQNVFGVTIPDGGRIRGDYIIPSENGDFSKPIVKERTDMLFCRDVNEVLLANDLLTLLNHSSLETDKPLLFKRLGRQFTEEVISLIKQNDLIEDFKKTTFINARNEDIPKLLELIEKIKKLRLGSEELLEKIKKANSFVLHSDNNEEIEQVRASYENLVKQYQDTLPYKLAILVEKYRNSMKPEGLTRQVIEDEWSETES